MGKRRRHHDQSLYFPITPASISLMNEANPPPRQGQSPEKWCNYMSLNRGGTEREGGRIRERGCVIVDTSQRNENGTFTRFLSLLNASVLGSVIWLDGRSDLCRAVTPQYNKQIIFTLRSQKNLPLDADGTLFNLFKCDPVFCNVHSQEFHLTCKRIKNGCSYQVFSAYTVFGTSDGWKKTYV